MGIEEILSRLIADAYRAALDERLWIPWMRQAAQALDSAGGALAVVDTGLQSVRSVRIVLDDEDALRDYVGEGLNRIDPQIPMAMNMRGVGTYVDTDHLDLDHADTRRHVDFVRKRVGWRHYMTGFGVLPDGRTNAGVSLHRTVAAGPVPPAERAKLNAIMPQLARALELGLLHAEKMTHAYWDGLLERQIEPAALLGERGEVLRLTPELEAIVQRGDGLDIVGDRLAAADPVSQSALEGVVHHAVIAIERRTCAASVARPFARSPYRVTAFPLPRRHAILPPLEAHALVTVIDQHQPAGRHGDLYREAFGFSPREAEFADMLCAGHSLESAAAALGIADPTARVHLRRLLAKSGTSRQAELLRLLDRVGRDHCRNR